MIDHGREFVGPLYIQEVIGLPTYDASFAKRLVYNTLDDKVYIGKVNIGWSVVGEGLGFWDIWFVWYIRSKWPKWFFRNIRNKRNIRN